MSDAIETIEHNGFTIEIHPDFDPMNPRKECDNLGTFWTQERRYNSPDDMPCASIAESVAKEFGGKASFRRDCLFLAVWKYEHSGVAYRAAESNPYHCPWDSGQVGYIFARKADIRKEYGVARITAAIREKALNVLKGEVEAYSKYANGEAYGYIVKDETGETVDSCRGFDDMEYCIEEAKSACQ